MLGVNGGALKLPFDVEIRIELGDEIRSGRSGTANRVVPATAVSSGRKEVVFDQDREGAIVRINARRGIPSESVGADITSQRAESEKMSAAEIVIIRRAHDDGAVRQYCGGGGRLVRYQAGTWSIGSGIDSGGSTESAGTHLVGDTLSCDG